MNWLAHLYLSEPTPEFRIGNLLPDMLAPADLKSLPEPYQRGVRQHCRIDAFTDSHPVVKQSVRRIGPEFRRYGGILVDVFYDHFLASNWAEHAEMPLEEFAGSVYSSFDNCRNCIPAETFAVLERMRSGDWLCSYRELSGIRLALNRLGQRLKRPMPLGDAVADLEIHHAEFQADFEAFFPELKAHVAAL